MQIFILTMGRLDAQVTANALPPKLRRKAVLVCGPGEKAALEARGWGKQVGEVVEQPKGVKGLPFVRQWIMDNAEQRRIVMLEDDLRFFLKTGANRRIVSSSNDKIEEAFAWMGTQLKQVAHCGMSPRFLNWQHPGPHIEATRMGYVLAYDRVRAKEADCSFTNNMQWHTCMEDFHMTLQLLRAGLINRVQVDHVCSPGTSNAAGGASMWRTLERHNESAKRLAKNHPGYVRVVEKKAWAGLGEAGINRLDVVVQWGRAYRNAAPYEYKLKNPL